jgi:urate oxidase
MKNTIDRKLDLMARSLQEHINLAKELNMNFVAQLLTMTAMEIKINLHRISDQEIDSLCASAEQHYAREEDEERESARVINFPRRGRYT